MLLTKQALRPAGGPFTVNATGTLGANETFTFKTVASTKKQAGQTSGS